MKQLTTHLRMVRKDSGFVRLILITVGIFLFMASLRPDTFLSLRNIVSMAYQFPEMGVLALAITVVFITGGMDLSLVGIANLSGILAGYSMVLTSSLPPLVSILIAVSVSLISGLACGLFNGVLISYLNVIPILATLGTMQLFTGMALIMTKGSAVVGFVPEFSWIGQGSFIGIPVPLLLFILIALTLWFSLTKTRYGACCYYIGTNMTASRFAGIAVKNILVRTYMVSGLLASIAGLIMISRVNSARADFGSSYTMQTILIAVLGGVSPLGGKGKVVGVVIAVLALQFLSSGFGMLRMSMYAKELVWGILLVALVALEILVDQKQR